MPVTGSTKLNKPYLVGVAGGSGSGKTYFAKALCARLGASRCAIVYQDSYYIDQSARFDHDGGAVNFDHPDAIDFTLLAQQLRALKEGRAVDIPVYDFVSHSRRPETVHTEPRAILVVDGILIFHSQEVRALFDQRLFFATPEALRFQRRLERDVKERGRKPEGVREQFLAQVKPMHDAYVEPSKLFAHTCVTEVEGFDTFLNAFVDRMLNV